MNMFAGFDENPAMTLRVIKETKRYGRTDKRTHGHTDARTDNVKTVYPLQTKFAGGIMIAHNILIEEETTKPKPSSSALDKLLGQLGIYATWFSSIAYLQNNCVFSYSFTPRFFL